MPNIFDVIIVGGSYAGLSAALTLGRSLKQVLVIDSGLPCNRKAAYSHNFITHDGESPASITATAMQQVLAYKNVTFVKDSAITASKHGGNFVIQTESGKSFGAIKLLFTTGVIDVLPDINGFETCWGVSILHCPYCHGYEVKGEKTGVLANEALGFEYVKMISNWTKKLTLFTHGPSTLTKEQTQKIEAHQIHIMEAPIHRIVQEEGQIKSLILTDGSSHQLSVLYARSPFRQHCALPQQLGCGLTEEGYIKVDELQRTTVPGIYAAGDNTTPFRSLAAAVAAGSKAGAFLNIALIEENF